MKDNEHLTRLLPENTQYTKSPGLVLVRDNTNNFHVTGILHAPTQQNGIWRVAGEGCGCIFHQDRVNNARQAGMTAIINMGG